ncbi:hypothetical protein BH24CHL1_BH24CHL1_19800 [soil metagenome]
MCGHVRRGDDMQSPGLVTTVLGRSLRLRCPRCGEGKFLEHGFTNRRDCRICRLRFEREEGYWTGAIYVNLITTQFLIIGGVFMLMFGTDLGLWTQISLLAAVGVIFPVCFYPFSKSIWLGMDYFFTGATWAQSPSEKDSPPLDSRS